MVATPAWPPRSTPRLFVGTRLSEGTPVRIESNQAHYLRNVMRITAGDAVMLCDDQTGEWLAVPGDIGKRDLTLVPQRMTREREAVPDITLLVAPLKKPAFDLVLEKATELGVCVIQPVLTRRCVVDKVNAERALATVTEAAEQCGRTALPRVAPLRKLESVLVDWPADRALFFADELGGTAAAKAFGAVTGPAALLIGPEGGFDDGERAAIRAHPNAHAISLGPRILRAETAAIAAAALWMAICGDWR